MRHRVERRPLRRGVDHLRPGALQHLAELVGDHPHPLREGVPRRRRLQRQLEMVEHRDQLPHQALVRPGRPLLQLARQALLRVVEVGHRAQIALLQPRHLLLQRRHLRRFFRLGRGLGRGLGRLGRGLFALHIFFFHHGKSFLVPERGVEPLRQKAADFKSAVSAIPPFRPSRRIVYHIAPRQDEGAAGNRPPPPRARKGALSAGSSRSARRCGRGRARRRRGARRSHRSPASRPGRRAP